MFAVAFCGIIRNKDNDCVVSNLTHTRPTYSRSVLHYSPAGAGESICDGFCKNSMDSGALFDPY